MLKFKEKIDHFKSLKKSGLISERVDGCKGFELWRTAEFFNSNKNLRISKDGISSSGRRKHLLTKKTVGAHLNEFVNQESHYQLSLIMDFFLFSSSFFARCSRFIMTLRCKKM